MPSINSQQQTLQHIIAVVQKHRSLSALNFDKNSKGQAQAFCYGVCRHYFQLSDIINGYLTKPFTRKNDDIFCLLLLGCYQLLYSKKPDYAIIFETVALTTLLKKTWAKSLVNAILRRVQKNKTELSKLSHHNHPQWLIDKLKKQYPQHWLAITHENNQQATMTLRVPAATIDNYQRMLEEKNINSYRIKAAPQALLLNQAVAVNQLTDFATGACFVQDVASQLAPPLLAAQPGDLILDACAAPGGKSTHLAQLYPKTTIIALDSSLKRLKKLTENISRHQLKNITVTMGDAKEKKWWQQQLFDKILLDAPCSGTGVIRRHPDIKILKTDKDVYSLQQEQKELLENLWTLLKKGGDLLYCTCSILAEENETQISQFLKRHSDAKLVDIKIDLTNTANIGQQCLPTKDMDGFYYAKLNKLS